ncbi:MAG: PAS domain S-box protein [Magnetococcales bacterium]|nr:PAS domain S-box protein [Magnetococcales bacterium]
MNSEDPAISLPTGIAASASAVVAKEGMLPFFPLVRHFSVTSFIAMILVGSALGWYLHQMQIEILQRLVERQNVALSRAFANSLWPLLQGLLRENDRLGANEVLVHSILASLDYTVQHLVRDLDVVKVKLYDKHGATIYSTSAAEIGQNQQNNPGFIAALAGDVRSQLTLAKEYPTWEGVLEDGDLVSSYIPLYLGNQVQGVFELYYDVSTSLKELSQVRNLAIVFSGVAFLLLYSILFFIVRRAQQLISQQNSALVAMLEQIRQINASLELRVEERTRRYVEINQDLGREIQERRRTELELRKLTRAVEQSPVSVVITDLNNHIEYVNPKFCQVTGYTTAEVIGKNPTIFKSDLMSPEEYRSMWETLKEGNEWRGEFHNLRKNGEPFWELAFISTIRDPEGHPTHYLAVLEDITQRKLSDEIIRRNELRLRTIMENVVEGIITADGAGIIESVNPAAERIFCIEASQLVGKNISMLVPMDHAKEHDHYISNYLTWFKSVNKHFPSDAPTRSELFFERVMESRRMNGESFSLELTVSHVCHNDRDQFVATVRDISERRRAQAELESTRQKSFQQEKMAAIGTLAAGIVHEIGNPIAAISGLVDELLDEIDGGQPVTMVEPLSLVHQQIQRLLTITREVSAFSQPQNDDRHLLDINGLVESTLRLMRFDKRVRNLETRIDLDRSLPAIEGSEGQLRQVFINLIINAADALDSMKREDPCITVTSSQRDDWVIVQVRDNGPGMDEEVRKHVFDAFFTTKPVGKGTGLGLSLCFNIVSDHGGEIVIDSRPGEGACFTVRLPISVTTTQGEGNGEFVADIGGG